MIGARDDHSSVIIIGAGIVGVSTALWLQRHGLRVTLVDPAPPGSGASFGNAGCFNASSTVPVAMPGTVRAVPRWLLDPKGPLALRWRYLPFIAPWLVRFLRAGTPEKVPVQARALRSILATGLADIQTLAADAGVPDLVTEEGHLVVYRDDAAFKADALAWRLRQDTGTVIQELDAHALRDFEPAVAPRYAKGIFIAENGHTANPGHLVARMAERMVRQGGTIVQARAIDFRIDGRHASAVRTDAGELAASHVVLAAGAHSRGLARLLGDAIPLDTERGYHVMIRDPEVQPRVSILDTIGRFVATPMEEGLRLAGTVELAGLKAPPDWSRANMLLPLGRALLPGLNATYPEERITRWMGFRPSMPDSLPVISPASAAGNAFHAFGHGHVGLASGASTGRIVADMVAGAPPSIDLSPFRADRFR